MLKRARVQRFQTGPLLPTHGSSGALTAMGPRALHASHTIPYHWGRFGARRGRVLPTNYRSASLRKSRYRRAPSPYSPVTAVRLGRPAGRPRWSYSSGVTGGHDGATAVLLTEPPPFPVPLLPPLRMKCVSISIGSGKMMVEFFSAEIPLRVWR